MKTLVLIPVRNEEQHVGSVVDRIAALYPELPVQVINDASQDSTREVIAARARTILINLPFRWDTEAPCRPDTSIRCVPVTTR